jgi:hypothetical protein
MIQEVRAVNHAAKVPTGSIDAAGVVAFRLRLGIRQGRHRRGGIRVGAYGYRPMG